MIPSKVDKNLLKRLLIKGWPVRGGFVLYQINNGIRLTLATDSPESEVAEFVINMPEGSTE